VLERKDSTSNPLTAKHLAKLLSVCVFLALFLFYCIQAFSPRVHSQPTIAAATTQPPVADVGQDCKQCHGGIVENFVSEAHGKSAKFLSDSRASSCQVCHTNSAEHAKASSRTKSGADPGNPAKLAVSSANESCLQCHSRDRYLSEWKGGKHDRNDVSCLSCHSVHHTKFPQWTAAARQRSLENRTLGLIDVNAADAMLSSLTVEETCFQCHSDKRKAMLQRSTHLFRSENKVMKVGCSSCHNPHGGRGPKMLVGRTLNDTCFQCHAEKRGPFLWEHAPVQENCMTCHTPHGSNNTRLLAKRSHQSCMSCHINMLARHSTVAGFDVFTFNQGCINCHTQIHGSNHPSGRAFTR
jgi:predicted CXXCH cytochrome family protein